MSDPIDPIMQAAERLRRLLAGEHIHEVYDEPYTHQGFLDARNKQLDDAERIAKWSLSILPKGKRPVAMALQGQAVEAGDRWFVDTDGEIVHRGCACDDCLRNTLSFTTKAEAELEYHWQEFEKFVAEFAAR